MKDRQKKTRRATAGLKPLPPEDQSTLQEQVARLSEALAAGENLDSLRELVTPRPEEPAWDLHLLRELEKIPYADIPPLLVALFAVSIANLGKAVPATIGGIGVYESILAANLIAFGISFDVAVVTAILDHFIKKAFTLGFGIPATFGLLGKQWGRTLKLLQTGR